MTVFRTVLDSTGGNNVGIIVPEETVLAFGRGKRVPVVVTIDGRLHLQDDDRRDRWPLRRLIQRRHAQADRARRGR